MLHKMPQKKKNKFSKLHHTMKIRGQGQKLAKSSMQNTCSFFNLN